MVTPDHRTRRPGAAAPTAPPSSPMPSGVIADAVDTGRRDGQHSASGGRRSGAATGVIDDAVDTGRRDGQHSASCGRRAALRELRAGFHGEVVLLGTPRTTRTGGCGTGRSTAVPAVIARCADVDDIARVAPARPPDRPPGRGSRRWAQLPGRVGVRRRADDRPLADDRGRGRTPRSGRRGSRPACWWAGWTPRPSRTGSRSPAASSATPG